MAEDNSTREQSYQKNTIILGGRMLADPPPGEGIVISGLSGSFPNSKDVYEFRDNLFNKANMISHKHRWDYTHPEIPACSGVLPNAERYDSGFFGVHERQGHSMDAMNRLFQQRAIEAILDAGLHPSDLENTRTGVFVGACFSESDRSWFFENLKSESYALTGQQRSMLAHRLSYFLKLKGPSYTIDTACSSSLYAFEHAYKALRFGEIDNAIIGGVNLCQHPFVSLQFVRLGVLSPEGACRPFDKMGNGYVRSEAAGALLLQRSKDARRIYAHVLHTKTNCDGYKPQGITYPSGEAQMELLNNFYDDCKVDRYSISFLEAHGTGTLVGDPEEGNAIDATLTKNRKEPLLIGSVKSNIGHSEPVSGICSITKCIIGMEEGFIPPNINFSEPRDEIKGLVEGRLEVVTEKMPFRDNRGLLAINSFGFGGGNCHLLLRWNTKNKINNGLPDDNLPRLVCVSGRTKEAVISLLDEIGTNVLDAEHIVLLYNVFRKNINNHLYRGYVLSSKAGEITRSMDYTPQIGNPKPLCIVFSKLNRWYEIGNHLLDLPVFADALKRVQQIVLSKGMNILDSLLHKSTIDAQEQTLGSLAVQIGIIEILKLLEIKTRNCFDYSFGEILSAYYEGSLNLEKTLTYALTINEALHKINSLDSDKRKYEPHQDINGTTIVNGDHLNDNVSELENLKLFLKSNNSGVKREEWFKNLLNILEKVTLLNKNASKAKFKSSDSTLDALTKSTQNAIGDSSVVLKIGSNPAYVDKIDDDIVNFPNSEDKNYLVEFLKTVGRLYELGYNPQIAKLYPPVNFPVSRGTRMVSPYIKWKHDRKFFFPHHNEEVANKAQHGAATFKIKTSDQEWSYLVGHVIDGRNLFPATGYLYLVWDTYSIIKGIAKQYMNVAFENCKFIRATAMSSKPGGYLQFNITIQKGTGHFEVLEGESPVVTGRIYLLEDEDLDCDPHEPTDTPSSEALPLTNKDIYKELRLRGYHYKGGFRAIQECNNNATKGYIKWEDNWVTFMDNMLQLKILQTDSRLLYVPTFISKLLITGQRHLDWINKNFVSREATPNLPVFNNTASGVISCGGIRLHGLIASSINRRKNLAVPVLESYKFIPNFANLDVQQSVRVNIQIILENTLLYKVNAVELIDECSKEDLTPLTPIIQSVLEDQPLIQPLVKILSKTPLDVKVPVEDKKLNSETDCLLVIASRILTRPETLKEAITSLRDNGYIISREPYEYDISGNEYSGLTVLTVHKTTLETILLLQKQSEMKPITLIKVDSSTNFSWVPTVQNAIKKKVNEDMVLCAESEPTNGIVGLVNCLRREPNGKNIKCVFITESTAELNLKKLYENQLRKNMAVNVYKNGQWGTYRHLLLNELSNTESEHCWVNFTVRGDLSSSKWLQGTLRHDMIVPPERRLVYVYYAALNFRDVMTAMGKINVDVITTNRREQECVQGFEFSGRDESGHRVMGMPTNGALSTLILADPYLMFRIPDSWTMQDGATVMTVYGTVVYGVVMRGQLKKGESVLIHSGTGGIGQAAIRFCLHYGCTVYTTVGTQEKREFLKKIFPQLKDCHIGNSHDESFEQLVYKGTKGRGVDMVVNSLAEEKLTTSVKCLARGGRFIEIGKFDVANNKYLNTLLFRKEASFHGVMLDQLFTEHQNVKVNIMRFIREGIESGVIKPLNSNIFKINEVEQAYRFMATGKHMGKVLIEVRKPEKELIVLPSIEKFSCLPRFNCDPEKTYVVIGGLGGFGLELADWLVLRGAMKLVLTSRKCISTGYQNLRIRTWRSYGAVVKICTNEIFTRDGCRQLIEECLQLGPLDAIFNLAVELADAIFENQTPESFVTSFKPKALATQYLDEVTREMCPDLSQFVVFSSVSCGRGNAEQTNYGMANSVMERICEKRKQDGYPALAIEWGAIGEVGLVAEMQEEHVEIEIGGTLQQKISDCLRVLDKLLMQQEVAIVSSMVVAEKRGAATANNIVDSVISILGLNDLKSVSLHSTLPELGMDSMTGVEIRQTLEREYEIFITAKDMRTLTLAKLKEMQEDKSECNQAIGQKDGSAIGLEVLFRAITDKSSDNLPFERLKSNIDETSIGPKVLLFPGIESVSRIYQPLSNQLNAHVIYFQILTERQKDSTIKDMAESIMPYVEQHVSKTEPYNIVAYSYGSLIALEVVNILESKGYTGTIIFIDGTPALMKAMLNNFNLESDTILETAVGCQLLSFYLSSEIVSKHEQSLFKCNSWDDRVSLMISIVKQYVSVDEDLQRNVANGIYWRLRALKIYTPSYSKLKSHVKLYKASQTVVPGLAEYNNLSEFFEKPVEVTTFEGNHATILDTEILAKAIDTSVNSNVNQQ